MTFPDRTGEHYPPEILTPGEVSRLIGQCSRRAPTGIRNRAMLWLLYRSGMRISELLALRPADLNTDTHAATALHAKGDKRVVYYWHPDADDALYRWVDERKRYGKHCLTRAGTPLFCTLEGKPLTSRYVRDMMKRNARDAGIAKRVHPHALRHSYAYELHEAGMTVGAISKLLGHSSIAITARYLDHLTNSEAGSQLQVLALPRLDVKP